MTDQFGVRHGELVTHAATVAAIADRVGTAQQAGASVRAGAEAYGKLCVMVPVMLGALQDVLVDGIAKAAESLHDTSGRLRRTADDYHGTDERRAKVLNQIRDQM
jgi:hypothetical protein